MEPIILYVQDVLADRLFRRRSIDPVRPESLVQYTGQIDRVSIQANRLYILLISVISGADLDRKSTRLNSSHTVISYAVFCLKKKFF